MSEDPERPRVVWVDDDRLQREMASDALSDLVAVETCAESAEALAALAREPAAVVFSDLTMPGPSGLDLLKQVRRRHSGTDFVLVTANATVGSAVDALRMGAADYLIKPIQWDELRLVLERILVRRSLVEENVRLRDSLAVVEACRVLASCLEVGDVHAVALDLVLRVAGRERGVAVFRRASLGDGLELRGYREDEASRLRRVLGQQKPIDPASIDRIQQIRLGAVWDTLREAGHGDGNVLAVPIPGDEAECGLILVPEGDAPFDATVEERSGVVAAHATVALRNAERYERAKDRAFIDDVTEVYNARYLMEAIDREVRRADRYGTELSLLFLDLDRFKLVNDRYGHLVGSQALRQLSQVLLECIRQVDTLARYGGDEFTIVLPDTGHEAARNVAERIRQLVEATGFEARRGDVMSLTCSLGFATFPLHGTDRTSLLDAADKAMYRAKSEGRNLVCSASELTR